MIFIRLPAQKSSNLLGRKGFEIFLQIFAPKNFVKKGEFTFCLLDIFCNITGVCYNAGGSHSVRGRGGVAVVLSLPPGGRWRPNGRRKEPACRNEWGRVVG